MSCYCWFYTSHDSTANHCFLHVVPSLKMVSVFYCFPQFLLEFRDLRHHSTTLDQIIFCHIRFLGFSPVFQDFGLKEGSPKSWMLNPPPRMGMGKSMGNMGKSSKNRGFDGRIKVNYREKRWENHDKWRCFHGKCVYK